MRSKKWISMLLALCLALSLLPAVAVAEGYHTVTVDPATRGAIAVSETAAVAGTRIYLTYPQCSYCPDMNQLSITDATGGAISRDFDFDSSPVREYFVMPDSDVTITAPIYNVYVNQPNGGTLAADKTVAEPGETVTVTVTPASNRVLTRLYYVIHGEDSETEYDIALTEGVYAYTFTMPSFDNAFPPVSVYAALNYVPPTASVSYVDENGETQSVTATLLTGAEPWTYNYGADVHLGTAGAETWYAVQGSVVYDGSNYSGFSANLIADGTVNLILCDGATLSGIGDLANGTFKIYGQTGGSGAAAVNKLRSTDLYLYGGSVTAGGIENLGGVTVGGGSLSGARLNCRALTVTGGTVNVPGILAGSVSVSGGTVTSVDAGEDETGVLCFEGLTVTGGTVTATGGLYGVRVNEGMSVSGGTVTITGGDKAICCMTSQWDPNPDNNVSITGGSVVINGELLVYSTLTLGWTNSADSVTINGSVTYDGTTAHDTGVVFAGTLFDGTRQLTPETTNVGSQELSGVRLVPYIPTRSVNTNYSYSSHGFATVQTGAMVGEHVFMTLEPALGCGLKSLTVAAGGDPVEYFQIGFSDVYYFVMPDANVNVTPVFSYMVTVEMNSGSLGEVAILVEDEETYYADPQDAVKVIVTPAKGVQITQFQLTRYTTTGNGQPINYSMEGVYGGPYTYSFTMPYDAAKVSVSFEPTRYTVALDVSGNGTASITTEPTGNDNTYHCGDRIYLSVTPGEGCVVDSKRYSYNDDGAQHSGQLLPTDDPTVWYFDLPASPTTVYISFAKASDITLSAVGPGTVVSDHTEDVAEGAWVMVTATPNGSSVSGVSYRLKSVSIVRASGAPVTVDSTQTVGSATRYYFYMPAEDVSVTAEFSSRGRVLLASAEHGALAFVSGNGWEIDEGSAFAVRVTPDANYKVSRVYYLNIDDANAAAVEITDRNENGNYTFTMPPACRLRVYAEFAQKDYAVTIAGDIENGSVSADAIRADEGETVTLTVAPDADYELDTLTYTVDGGAAVAIAPDAAGAYSFVMPDGDVTVSAAFARIPSSECALLNVGLFENGQALGVAEQDGTDFIVTLPDGYTAAALSDLTLVIEISEGASATVNGEAWPAEGKPVGSEIAASEAAAIVVTAEDGTTSASYALTIAGVMPELPPTITAQPRGCAAPAGTQARFTVAASEENVTYQWQYSVDGGETWKNSTYSTAKSATLKFTAQASYDGRLFRCLVTGAYGTTTSGAAALTICEPLTVTLQPEDRAVRAGKTASFTVMASEEDVTYQWQYSSNGGETWKNSTYSTAKSATLSFKAQAGYDGRLFRCVVTGAGGKATSETATLSVSVPPTITEQPADVSVKAGKTASFTVMASEEDVTYQWQYSTNGGASWKNSTYSTAKSATLSFKAQAGYDGRLFRCVVTGAGGKAVSSAATLSVSVPPTITEQPADATAAVGKTVRFTVAASEEDVTYQWQYSADGGETWKNSTYSTAKSATLSFKAQAGYDGRLFRCVVTNADGKTVSSTATLTIG